MRRLSICCPAPNMTTVILPDLTVTSGTLPSPKVQVSRCDPQNDGYHCAIPAAILPPTKVTTVSLLPPKVTVKGHSFLFVTSQSGCCQSVPSPVILLTPVTL